MSETVSTQTDPSEAYALQLHALQNGMENPDLAAFALSDRDRAFWVVLFAAFQEDIKPGQPAFDAFASKLDPLDPFMTMRGRYGRCPSWFTPDDRAWLLGELKARLLALHPELELNGPPQLWVQRLGDRLPDRACPEATHALTLVGLVGLMAAPLARPRATGALTPPATVAPASTSRTMWVNGKPIEVTTMDGTLVNMAVAGTVGLVVFILAWCKLINWLPPTYAFPAAAGLGLAAGWGWLLLQRLPPELRNNLQRLYDDVLPYYKIYGVALLSLAASVFFLVTGEIGIAILCFCAGGGILWFYWSRR